MPAVNVSVHRYGKYEYFETTSARLSVVRQGLRSSNLTPREQLLDALADLLLQADGVISILETEDAVALRHALPRVREVYDAVNEIMQGLAS